VGYVAPTAPGAFDHADALTRLRAVLPAALVPMIATVDTLPTRTSGKVDRAALPWPLPLAGTGAPTGLAGTQAWLAERWGDVLGAAPASADDDFFASGGTSLGAARLVSLLRQTYPGVSVADVYQHRTARAQAARRGGSRSRPAVPGCCCAAYGRVVTRAAAASTCDCGPPRSWPPPAAPTTWPGSGCPTDATQVG